MPTRAISGLAPVPPCALLAASRLDIQSLIKQIDVATEDTTTLDISSLQDGSAEAMVTVSMPIFRGAEEASGVPGLRDEVGFPRRPGNQQKTERTLREASAPRRK